MMIRYGQLYDEVYYDDSMHAMACTLYGQIMYAFAPTVCTLNCNVVETTENDFNNLVLLQQ